MNYDFNEKNIRAAAIDTILDIWSCIDWERVDRKRLVNIWDEVTSKVKAAAMTTNNYEKFIEKLARKLDVRSLKYRTITDIQKQDKKFKDAVLKLIREETLTIMLEVRANNEIRKEQVKIQKEKEEKEKKLNEKLDNAKVKFTEKGVKVDEN